MSITARASATLRASRRCSKASAPARSAIRSWTSRKAAVVIVIGANPTVNHPVAATFIKNAMRNGTKLIVMDPRRSELARTAYRFLQFKPDTDVALLNAMMHVIIEENLVDAKFIADRTLGYAELAKNVAGLQPGADGADLRHSRGYHSRGRAAVCDQLRLHDSLGHGHQPAYSRHRQCPLSHRAGADDGPDRQTGYRAASAARTEQCAGRIGCRAHSDDVSGLSARRQPPGASSASRRPGTCPSTSSTTSRG